MIAQGRNVFAGSDCPINTYGAAGRVYGWASAPCKPCPRNMVTDNATRVNTSSACINPDGFGYSSEGVSKCAPAFYAAKGTLKPCIRCECPQQPSFMMLPAARLPHSLRSPVLTPDTAVCLLLSLCRPRGPHNAHRPALPLGLHGRARQRRGHQSQRRHVR